MMQWEYKAERVSVDMVDKLEALLNEFGGKGWELAYFREVTDLGGVTTSHCIFKRPVLQAGIGIGGIAVEGESGEAYEGVVWNSIRRAATQQIARYRNPGART